MIVVSEPSMGLTLLETVVLDTAMDRLCALIGLLLIVVDLLLLDEWTMTQLRCLVFAAALFF